MKVVSVSVLLLSIILAVAQAKGRINVEECQGKSCSIRGGVDLSQGAIDVQLPNAKTLSCVGGSYGNNGWTGRCENAAQGGGHVGSADFINDNGRLFGSVVDEETGDVCQFQADSTGQNTVVCTPTSEFPDEGEPQDEGVSTDPAVPQYLRGIDASSFRNHEGNRQLQTSQMDVLVVWTSKSECRNSGLSGAGCSLTATTEANMRARIDLAMQETNTAYTSSGVNTQLNLVHAYRDPTYVEASSDAFGTALTSLRSSTDGVMDDVHTKRTQYGADIVAMIIDDAQYCGIAYLGPRTDLMFSVTKWSCATGYYSFGHEVSYWLRNYFSRAPDLLFELEHSPLSFSLLSDWT